MTSVRVAIAGCTGSIGTQTLEVVEAEPDRFEVSALGASGRSTGPLIEAARRCHPKVVAVADEAGVTELRAALGGVEIRVGRDALASVAEEADVVVNGIVGFAGLPVTLATLRSGRRLALANKESLIAGGPLVQEVRRTPGAELIPVDSEHSAVHQCLRANDIRGRVDRIVLTASGGPFRGRSRAELMDVTLEDALDHPTWNMGPKITVDSSTLMNKGLEVIEAHELFGPPAGEAGESLTLDRIEVVVHPQSLVHSLVEFTDGATIAQVSRPDMRLAIGYALAYPDRLTVPFGRMDWSQNMHLDFEPPDLEVFPCLRLAFEAGRMAGSAPAWLNAANECAVEGFLNGRIPWFSIAEVLEEALARHDGGPVESLESLVELDLRARQLTESLIEERS